MKKFFYILSFVFLGVLVSTLVHGGIEIPMINLLIADFGRFGLGLSWESWATIHNVIALILLVLGIALGFQQGMHWWRVIYIEKRFGTNKK